MACPYQEARGQTGDNGSLWRAIGNGVCEGRVCEGIAWKRGACLKCTLQNSFGCAFAYMAHHLAEPWNAWHIRDMHAVLGMRMHALSRCGFASTAASP